MDKQKLIHQLFIGKVADVLGVDKTTELLNEAKKAFDTDDVVDESERLKALIQNLLENNMCSHAGDELIQKALMTLNHEDAPIANVILEFALTSPALKWQSDRGGRSDYPA